MALHTDLALEDSELDNWWAVLYIGEAAGCVRSTYVPRGL